MSKRAHGQIRRSQVITTWGPGALLDLPRHSAIVGGLDTWPGINDLEEIVEPFLSRKLQEMTGVAAPRLYAPPADSNDPREPKQGITVYRFPEWFIVQEAAGEDGRQRSRRLVPRRALDEQEKFDGHLVVATRFVRGCPRGHVDDLDWHTFVHGGGGCRRQLWLDERGTSGDLGENVVRCECKRTRGMHEAMVLEDNPLGTCRGRRPWLGLHSKEDCTLPSRLLTRTAANAYFPQVVSVLSLPDQGSAVQGVVRALWDDLQIVDTVDQLAFLKKKPQIADLLSPFSNDAVLEAIGAVKGGRDDERPVKHVEIEAILAAPEGFGDDVPVDPDFHARRLPDAAWRQSSRSDRIESVIQLHRLREVLASAASHGSRRRYPTFTASMTATCIVRSSPWNPSGSPPSTIAAKGSSSSFAPRPCRAGWSSQVSRTGSITSPQDMSGGSRTARASVSSPAGRTFSCTRSRIF